MNREATAEPPASRGGGPDTFHATGEWLRGAFSDLVWTTEQSIVENDLAVTFGTMSGRHTGNFVVWTEDAKVERAFVSTGKTFSVRQAHFQRIRDGLVIEHRAVRDDQGMALQAGWIPPTPAFLIRCASHEESPSCSSLKLRERRRVCGTRDDVPNVAYRQDKSHGRGHRRERSCPRPGANDDGRSFF